MTDLGPWKNDVGRRAPAQALTGSVAQVEWAERIRVGVTAEFDRVAAAFQTVAEQQHPAMRARTESVIRILEDTRAQVMSNPAAGYFIHDWQDISDQVRQMIFSDPRYQAIKIDRNRGPLPRTRKI